MRRSPDNETLDLEAPPLPAAGLFRKCCAACGHSKTAAEFFPSKYSPDLCTDTCRPCVMVRSEEDRRQREERKKAAEAIAQRTPKKRKSKKPKQHPPKDPVPSAPKAKKQRKAKSKTKAKAKPKAKSCRSCRETKPVAEFQKWKRAKDGLRHDCKACCEAGKAKRSQALEGEQREKDRKRRAKPHRRAANFRSVRDWQRRNPKAAKAHKTLQKAIKKGLVQKPDTCAVDDPDHGGRIEAHHVCYDSPLDVCWMCSRHHRRLHALYKFEVAAGVDPLLAGLPNDLR